MRIEPARQEDVSAIAALWHAGWHDAHAEVVSADLVATRVPEEFTNRARAHLARTFVARNGEGIAGFFMLDGSEVYQFYVDALLRGSGAAAALMSEAERHLKGKLARLDCTVGNDRAARFYEKAGWQRGAQQSVEVETAQGPMAVTVWRFTKDLRQGVSDVGGGLA